MNLSLINTEERDLAIGDEVEIISNQNNNKNSIVALAQSCNTIPYTILTGINSQLKRIIIT